ncbi:transposable element Tcb1 transposase [Trichonephila clavipes]|nr:transposable element Tcb1 transposase [Trichonephila clavipes]
MTIQRRIQQLNEDIENQVKSTVSNFVYCSLAVDEFTDRTSVSQLLVFVRRIDKKFCVTEELGMFPMKLQTTGSELLSSLIHLCHAASLNMNNCVRITTDGAKLIIGTKIGMVTLLKERALPVVV